MKFFFDDAKAISSHVAPDINIPFSLAGFNIFLVIEKTTLSNK